MTDKAWREHVDQPAADHWQIVDGVAERRRRYRLFATPGYQVMGESVVLDHKPGEIFYADIPPVQELRLIQGGHIRRLPPELEPDLPRLDDPNPEQKQQETTEPLLTEQE